MIGAVDCTGSKHRFGDRQSLGAILVGLRRTCESEMNMRMAFFAARPLLRRAPRFLGHMNWIAFAKGDGR
ncbi:MAG: hypothetical protein WCC90_15060 [Methylocella sp.]